MKYIALVSDLVFRSKIRETATACNAEVVFVKDEARLLEETKESSAIDLLIVDLNINVFDVFTALPKIIAQQNIKRMTGFCSHVDTERISKAHEIGLSEVMARSKFITILPQLFH